VHGSSVGIAQNYLDLDPTYKDAWGLPLLRMTFDFPENDLKMSAYITDKAVADRRAMGGRRSSGAPRKGPYTITQYQTTHNTGGTVMGTDPSTSTVNRYCKAGTCPTCS
jgi:gluconate 2-dehydrogenase alpha chain